MTIFDNLTTVAAPWISFFKWACITLSFIIPLAGWRWEAHRVTQLQALQVETVKARDIAAHDRDSAIAANSGMARQLSAQNGQLSSLASSCEGASKEPQKAAQAVMAAPVKVSKDHGPKVMNDFFQELARDL